MVTFGGLPSSEDPPGSERQWLGHAAIRGPAWARMFLLTASLLGLQVAWAVEMSYASPYLLSLGLSKSLMSLVFVAGPLSGLVVQPLIGTLADRSKSRWGRRRPFMMAGSMMSVAALLLLGFTRDFTSLLVEPSSNAGKSLTISLAVLSIYLLDFSINAVQAMDRALLVDTLPAAEQELGNAWAARLSGVGSMIGFFTGYLDLVHLFPWLGRNQLEVLAVISSFILVGTHVLTSLCVTERVLLHDGDSSGTGVFASIREIWSNVLTLPHTIREICLIQFFNWIAWFPVLFYSSEWVGEIYIRNEVQQGRNATDPNVAAEAKRIGSEALFWNSVVNLVAIIILPMLLVFATRALARRSSTSEPKKHNFIPVALLQLITLPYMWLASHFVFAMMMFLTFIVSSVWGANWIMSVLGFSAAINQWAPFSLLGEVIQAHSPIEAEDFELPSAEDAQLNPERAALMASSEDLELHDMNGSHLHGRKESASSLNVAESIPAVLHVAHDQAVSDSDNVIPKNDISDKAGIILGIHNIAIVVPQFLVTALCALVFALLEPNRSISAHPANGVPVANTTSVSSDIPVGDVPPQGGKDSIGVVMRIGGVSALVACYYTLRLARELGSGTYA